MWNGALSIWSSLRICLGWGETTSCPAALWLSDKLDTPNRLMIVPDPAEDGSRQLRNWVISYEANISWETFEQAAKEGRIEHRCPDQTIIACGR